MSAVASEYVSQWSRLPQRHVVRIAAPVTRALLKIIGLRVIPSVITMVSLGSRCNAVISDAYRSATRPPFIRHECRAHVALEPVTRLVGGGEGFPGLA